MTITNVTRTARLYMRAELLTVQIRLRSEARRLVLVGFAGFLAVLGVGLINLALYAALQSIWGPVWTPLALGGLDIVLAAIALVAAALQKPGPELAMAEEMRTLAGNALEEQVHAGVPGASLLGGLTGDTSAARLLIPVVTTIIGALRKRKEAKG